MEFEKEFEFKSMRIREDHLLSYHLNGVGSFVISGPDWPDDSGFPEPENDGDMAEEFLGALKEAMKYFLFDDLSITYMDIPHSTETLTEYINNEALPFRWEFETGYRLEEITFVALYPADEESTERLKVNHRFGAVFKKIKEAVDRMKELEPDKYEIDENGAPQFDWDNIDKGHTKFTELFDRYKVLQREQFKLLKYCRDISVNDLIKAEVQLIGIRDQRERAMRKREYDVLKQERDDFFAYYGWFEEYESEILSEDD